MPEHTVKQGECLSRIASLYGFGDWRTLYEDPANAELRAMRPDPNVLCPGDVVFIPERSKRQERCSTDATYRFQIRRPKRTIRLVVLDAAGHPVAGAPYTLAIGDSTRAGVTDGAGVVECTVPLDAEQGTLVANGHAWPLRIGHLDPVDETPDGGVTGIQARLRNLGYDPGRIDGRLGPRTT